MKSPRDQILGRLRRSLGSHAEDMARRQVVDQRLSEPPRGPIPARSRRDRAGQIALFVEQTKAVDTTVETLAAMEEVPEALARFCKEHNIEGRLRITPAADLQALDWGAQSMLEVAFGRPEAEDPIGLARALAGIAETGTLMLHSGPEGSTTLNFLPETCVVVVKASEIVGPYEDAWDRLREALGGVMPRTVNMISGPSRTADVEQTLTLGAHGPRRLHLLLIEDEPAP